MYHGGPGGVLFTGTRGTIEVNRSYLKSSPEGILDEKIGDDELKLYKATSHMGDWLECVRERKQPICNAEIGCRSATICHLGNLAYWHKRDLKWNPDQYHIVGDDEADTWLDRPTRDPWTLEG